jgi:FkbM family methyltransferase
MTMLGNYRSQSALSMMSMRLMQKQWASQYSGVEQVCDASEKCNGQCWAHVKEGTGLEFEMKVLQNDFYISRGPLCGGDTWEYGDVIRLLDMLGAAEHGTFLDIGANLGSWSLPIAMHKQQYNVVAVDVSSTATNLLQESVNKNNMTDRFHVNRFAVIQDAANTKTICMSASEQALAASTNMGGNMVNLGEREFCAEAVPADTLDSLYSNTPALKNVIAAKLDCEGCEAQALLGGSRFLSESPPCVLAMEITPPYLCSASTSVKQLSEFLETKGYSTAPMFELNTTRISCEEVIKAPLEQNFVYVQQRDMPSCLAKFT